MFNGAIYRFYQKMLKISFILCSLEFDPQIVGGATPPGFDTENTSVAH